MSKYSNRHKRDSDSSSSESGSPSFKRRAAPPTKRRSPVRASRTTSSSSSRPHQPSHSSSRPQRRSRSRSPPPRDHRSSGHHVNSSRSAPHPPPRRDSRRSPSPPPRRHGEHDREKRRSSPPPRHRDPLPPPPPKRAPSPPRRSRSPRPRRHSPPPPRKEPARMERALRPEPSSRATATSSSLSYDSYKLISHSPAIREPVVREAESTSASAQRSSDSYRYDDPSKWRTEVTTYPTSQEAMSTRERQTVGYDDYRMGASTGQKYTSATNDTLRGPAPAVMPLPPVDASYSTNIANMAFGDLPPLQERLSEGVKVYKDKDERIRQSPPRSPPRYKSERKKKKVPTATLR